MTSPISAPGRFVVILFALSLCLASIGCSDDGTGGTDWDIGVDASADTSNDSVSDSVTDSDDDSGEDATSDTDPEPDATDDTSPDPDTSADTGDTGPDECDEPAPSDDCRVTGCSGEQTCIVWDGACSPSSCSCSGGQWSCSRDCDPESSVCVDDPDFCADENLPSNDCRDYGCDEGYSCELDESGCRPSSCQCDPVEQEIICTEDCRELYECVREADTCNGVPNPAGCSQTGCPAGENCVKDSNECAPSTCSCDEDSGWLCTSDCGGGGTCQ